MPNEPSREWKKRGNDRISRSEYPLISSTYAIAESKESREEEDVELTDVPPRAMRTMEKRKQRMIKIESMMVKTMNVRL